VSRSQAQRNRQLQQENEAAELRKRNLDLDQKAQALAAAQAQHLENVTHFDADLADGEEYLNRRLEEIDAAEDALQRERDQVNALKVQYESKKVRIESEAAAMWKVIGDAAATTKAWQGEVQDQIALESRVARVRGKVRPGGGLGGAGSGDDDDLSDLPF
jgi:predicted nuclease with TOPRIM domain